MSSMHPIRKPRVFLSHSKKDITFIRKLDADLRATQCEPWIDELELRAGQPWLDQLFGSGIPSCEIVLCYVTPNSIESAVFQQEMDARLLERLQNARVSLLIYVSAADLRTKLRLDLQRFQMPEFNSVNYAEVLPRVVAEVWRSYSESVVLSAIEAEKVKRLEAELRVKELESNASATVFSSAENAEFTTVWSRLDRETEFNAEVVKRKKPEGGIGSLETELEPSDAQFPAKHKYSLKLGVAFRRFVLNQKFQPSPFALHDQVERDVLLQLGLDGSEFQVACDLPVDIEAELLRYGFVERQYAPPPPAEGRLTIRRLIGEPFKLMFTAKFDRFAFWVEYSFGSLDPLAIMVRAK